MASVEVIDYDLIARVEAIPADKFDFEVAALFAGDIALAADLGRHGPRGRGDSDEGYVEKNHSQRPPDEPSNLGGTALRMPEFAEAA